MRAVCMTPCPPVGTCTLNWFPPPCICMVSATAPITAGATTHEAETETRHSRRRSAESAA